MTDNSAQIHDFARQFAQYTNRNVFLTGKAGTGKTTFLHHLRETTGKQMAVVAPTGVAAINAGGTTIHSFFQLPLTPFIPTPEGKKDLIGKLKMLSRRRNVLRQLELLVIDEISMVRADVLDAIDTILRHIRYRHNDPFGGVQVIFIGDMYQLSPVAQNDEWQILSKFYNSIYFFHSHVILQHPPIHIEFEKIFRQKDMSFITLLNEVRNDCLSDNGLNLLQKRYNPSFKPPKDDTYIILTTHNYKADRINTEELAQLEGKVRTFKAVIEGDFPEKSYPLDENLDVKIGAKVMFVKNDTETVRRFFNGKIGEITAFNADKVIVKCPEDTDEIEVTPMVWENIRYKANETTLRVDEEILGTFTQFPLRLAWAITIHKSQGLTFDKAVIDAEAAFAPGQVYVALSRCRSLEGIVLQSQINRYSIENDEEIVRFSARTDSVEELRTQLDVSKRNYHNVLLLSIFDFRMLANTAERWQKELKEVASSFNGETSIFVNDILKQTAAIQDVGVKFQQQISQICSTQYVDADLLSSRLKASSAYFTEKLNNLSDSLRLSPAATDSRQNAKTYDEGLMEIFSLAEQKKHQIKGLENGFGIDEYFELKNNFKLPYFAKTSYAKHADRQELKSIHPNLTHLLFELRNEICDEMKLPIYLVVSSKSIVEMSNYLPQTEKDLLRIHGFGQAKVDKFGKVFLGCIHKYCSEHHLTSTMNELIEKTKQERKEKPPKGESERTTLTMYLDNKSIEKIAEERNLAVSTIAGHLAKMVETGALKISRFVSEEKQQQALKLLEENKNSDESVFAIFSTLLNPQETSIMCGWLRGGRKDGKI